MKRINATPALLFLALTIISVVPTVEAGVILQAQGTSWYQIDSHEPLGQSFKAEDQSVYFAFWFSDANQHVSNEEITVSILSGAGLGGSVLAQKSALLTPQTSGGGFGIAAGEFIDFDFTDLQLVVGETYTASVEAQNARWGLRANSGSSGGSVDTYTDGMAYFGGTQPSVEVLDFRFRVTPEAVPEPSILFLFSLGLVGFGLARKRSGAL